MLAGLFLFSLQTMGETGWVGCFWSSHSVLDFTAIPRFLYILSSSLSLENIL